jgi:hypothetical protein
LSQTRQREANLPLAKISAGQLAHAASPHGEAALFHPKKINQIEKIVRPPEIDAGQVLIGGKNTIQILARNVQKPRQPRADTDKNGFISL